LIVPFQRPMSLVNANELSRLVYPWLAPI